MKIICLISKEKSNFLSKTFGLPHIFSIGNFQAVLTYLSASALPAISARLVRLTQQ
jgi:hypothetical protein